MAHGPVRHDPAIDRFNEMREKSYINFRWTRRTVRTGILGFIVAPLTVYFIADTFNKRYTWNALKGESMTVKQSEN